MASSETNGDGRAINPSGVYRHPDTGEELVTQATAKFGNPQADAIVRMGFVYVGPLSEKSDLQPAADPGAAALANTTPGQKTVAELEAELTAAKERDAAVTEATKGKSDLVDSSSKTSSDSTDTSSTTTTASTTSKGAK